MLAKISGFIGAFWGIGGVLILFSQAAFRLSQRGIEAFSEQHVLTWYHWLTLVVCVVFMGYSEGYKAFQLAFCPRVASRAQYLSKNPHLLHVILAPAFCMGFFHATKKRIITSICVTAGVIFLILIVSQTPQPWRGLIDIGVVVGLAWGVMALIYFSWRAFTCKTFAYPPDLPEAVIKNKSIFE
ncbi:MAG: hypothetical protein AAGA64_00100 [Bacteroidota bacterium]